MTPVRERRSRCAPLHHHYRKRIGHPEREHDHHRTAPIGSGSATCTSSGPGGRYKHQAYAYLLLPRHAGLLADARKRISAIKQYSSLGSGFKSPCATWKFAARATSWGRAERPHHCGRVRSLLPVAQAKHRRLERRKGAATNRGPNPPGFPGIEPGSGKPRTEPGQRNASPIPGVMDELDLEVMAEEARQKLAAGGAGNLHGAEPSPEPQPGPPGGGLYPL